MLMWRSAVLCLDPEHHVVRRVVVRYAEAHLEVDELPAGGQPLCQYAWARQDGRLPQRGRHEAPFPRRITRARLNCFGNPAQRDPGGQAVDALNDRGRSEEHTSELQSHSDLVCRLLLEK